MQTITNWKEISALSKQKQIPIVIMVDQEDCPYCDKVESEFFAAILAGKEFDDKAIIGKMSLDDGHYVVTETNEKMPSREFLHAFAADFTPTILFLDSEANELVEKMVGLSTPDYYGYYLEKAIKLSYQRLNA